MSILGDSSGLSSALSDSDVGEPHNRVQTGRSKDNRAHSKDRKLLKITGQTEGGSTPVEYTLSTTKPVKVAHGQKVKLAEGKAPNVKASESSGTRAPSTGKKRKARITEEVATPEKSLTVAQDPSKKGRKRKIEAEEEIPRKIQDRGITATNTPKATKKRKTQVQEDSIEAAQDEKSEGGAKRVKRKRKTKEEREAEAMPLAARTVGHKMFIGAHVSSAGGVHNAVTNSLHIGANAFALFLKSQRKWANPALQPDHAAAFRAHCTHHTYDQAQHVLPHGSYLVNLAHTDPTRATQAYDCFIDDLRRCESLGIRLYNFHPGNSVGNDRDAAIAYLGAQLNKAHAATNNVVTVLENMAASGNVLGSTFEDLRDIISHVEDKSRVGVCIDTCHAFAAGYDLRSPSAFQSTLRTFDRVVGMRYLRALHLNDSKAPLGARRDLHANIGTGFLGLRAFHNIVNEPRFAGLPMVLETPIEVKNEDGVPVKDEKGKEKEDKGIWAGEIKLLESLIGMDVESEGFLEMERSLARKGESERKRLTEQVERREEKERKAKGKEKGTKVRGKKKDRKRKEEEVINGAESDTSELSSLGSDCTEEET
ncbi:DNA-(apurinic or apyrimidinic site) lyase [Elasticomyces elasticus]|nr:DNA-(apurinic or apyrimidinic site) lyase [Elasticomyces elasticus]